METASLFPSQQTILRFNQISKYHNQCTLRVHRNHTNFPSAIDFIFSVHPHQVHRNHRSNLSATLRIFSTLASDDPLIPAWHFAVSIIEPSQVLITSSCSFFTFSALIP
ncbi:hypothetical protein Droror1_Dr00017710 [Drosera rotundifolia]